MKNIFVIIYLFAFSLSSFGTEFLQISDLGTSAKMIALGNIEGFDCSAASVFENPAGLHRIQNISVAYFHTSLLKNALPYNSVAVAYKGSFGTFAFGYMGVEDTNIFLTNKTAGVVGITDTAKYANQIFKLGWQTVLWPRSYIGLNLSYFNHKIIQDELEGNGFNTDIGYFWEDKASAFSLCAKNVVPFFKIHYSNNKEEALPVQVVASGSKSWNDFRFFSQIKIQSLNVGYLKAIGIEYRPYFLGMLSIAFGWKEINIEQDIFNNFTMGMSLNLNSFGISIAYENAQYFEQDNLFFISAYFNL